MSGYENLPKHWQVKKLGEVGEIVSGGTPSTKVPEYWNGNISWISPADLSGYRDKVIFKGRKSISESGLRHSSARLIPKGSVLFSSRAPIGYTVIAGNDVCTNQGFKSIVHNNLVISDYLFHFLKSSKDKAEKAASGTTFKEISLKAFSQLEIPIPPLPEQQAIVSKIEELLSDLENGKQQLQTAQQQLKVYRQSLLKAAFEGKLVGTGRVAKGHVRTGPVRTGRDLSVQKNGELPKGWKWVKLWEESNLITKGASPKWQGISYVEDTSQVLFITSENVRNNHLDVSKPKYLENSFNEKQKRSVLQNGDILLNIVGASIGRATIFNLDIVANINQAVAVIRLKKDVSKKFVSYYLNSNHAKNYYNLNKVDFARANLSLEDVSNITFPLPPLDEQQRIVAELESKLTVCDKIDETINNSLQQAETLRQSILKKAFEGKLT